MHDESSEATPQIEIEEFWQWLQSHPNCILRAGTKYSVFYDHEDHHWALSTDADGNYSVQILRGKVVISELRILAEEASFARQTAFEDDGERLYEIFIQPESATGDAAFGAYHFLVAHGMDEGEVQQNDVPQSGGSGRGGHGGHWSH